MNDVNSCPTVGILLLHYLLQILQSSNRHLDHCQSLFAFLWTQHSLQTVEKSNSTGHKWKINVDEKNCYLHNSQKTSGLICSRLHIHHKCDIMVGIEQFFLRKFHLFGPSNAGNFMENKKTTFTLWKVIRRQTR